MGTFILCVAVAITFFALGGWLWPKVTGAEARLRAEIEDLRSKIPGDIARKW